MFVLVHQLLSLALSLLTEGNLGGKKQRQIITTTPAESHKVKSD